MHNVTREQVDVIELKDGVFPKILSRFLTKMDDVNSVADYPLCNRIDMGLNFDPAESNLDPPRGAYFRIAELYDNFKRKTSENDIITTDFELESYATNDAVVFSRFVLVPVGASEGGLM